LFISERVTNTSRPGRLTGYVLSFYVSHSSDPELAPRVPLAAAATHPDVLREPAAQVEFVDVSGEFLGQDVVQNAKVRVGSRAAIDEFVHLHYRQRRPCSIHRGVL